jgi:hypothetical protein
MLCVGLALPQQARVNGVLNTARDDAGKKAQNSLNLKVWCILHRTHFALTYWPVA